MNLKFLNDTKIRISPNSEPDGSNFIDIAQPDKSYGLLAASFNGFSNYIEVREKDSYVRVFQFSKKGHKREHDFGWWKDAEVVYSFNRNGKDK